MSIEKRSDLFREYARVIDICEGAGVTPNACVRFDGTPWLDVNRDEDPEFDSPLKFYTFAVAILEGKPVFVGDEVYLKDGRMYDWNTTWMEQTANHLTWNKPKQTFTLAGRELPLPVPSDIDNNVLIGCIGYSFNTSSDRNNFITHINAIISEAMENARLQDK